MVFSTVSLKCWKRTAFLSEPLFFLSSQQCQCFVYLQLQMLPLKLALSSRKSRRISFCLCKRLSQSCASSHVWFSCQLQSSWVRMQEQGCLFVCLFSSLKQVRFSFRQRDLFQQFPRWSSTCREIACPSEKWAWDLIPRVPAALRKVVSPACEYFTGKKNGNRELAEGMSTSWSLQNRV